ncbi:DNA phosphorothioation system sulfurtransferase DndC [Mesorhizobium sp.]|uniref:DNA phosphorothioation system sulfurtransferase DndC n=1 Tax=Mesorhizobium sp. TaxID=1871066 RepID=UPI000FE9FAA1|nr:DNA phosphorothioation system sulfurtransferase DndC [Mesorhizobium sp.]RWA97445.1 MAG: DNA phosphorothioation system sulfurtransferase DndC [Mesorhizobium sp.]
MNVALSQLLQPVSIDDTWRGVLDHVKEEYLSQAQRFPWIVGFSGGKDSTLVTHAIFEMLLEIAPSQRSRPIHIVSNDTLVESPMVMSHLNVVTKQIEEAAVSLGLPITVARTQPDPDKTFWVLLIGKGYPSPNMTMRWCTDRLKIQPTSGYIKGQVSASGAAIIVLGVRRDESQSRQRSIERRRNVRGENLSEHDRLPGAFIFRPIIDLSVDDVWEILGTSFAPWGGNHTALIQLYRDSEGGECPVVLSSDEAPGCGTSNSRFGCWTCTVVEKDKSLQGFVDAGMLYYQPLIEFRDWLKAIRNRTDMRQAFRRNGRLTFDANGKHIPGPFTIQARKEIFERLMAVQEGFDGALISESEIKQIRQIWADELQGAGSLADV